MIKESRTHSTPKQRAFLHFEVLSVFTGGTRISSAEWSQNMKQIYHTALSFERLDCSNTHLEDDGLDEVVVQD